MTDNLIDKKLAFLYAAITDTVGTIRSLDVKNQIFLGICLIPLAQIKYFLILSQKILNCNCICLNILMVVILLFWLLSIVSLIKGIRSRFNPEIKGDNERTGYFFQPGTIKNNKYTNDFEMMYKKLPQDEDTLLKEVAFEHMKLCLIRDCKATWHNLFLVLFFLWIILGIILMILLFSQGFNFCIE
ncbi:MAG: hypothetical protein LBG58_07880 [Planctomycetaceae bacterium]|jgi:hypothetical protein|nr:hypothetical protein [Planctomycetaceae bacterium]